MSKMRKKATELRRRVQKIREDGMIRGSEWLADKEWIRGFFHFSVGFTGWLLLQIVRITMELLGLLLVMIGSGMFIVEILRIYLIKKGVVDNRGIVSGILRWLLRYLYRGVEKDQHSNLYHGFLGLGVAWLFCYLAEAPWIATGVCLAFSLVDPVAKLGKRWPIMRFVNGPAKGKSVGGFLYGLTGGLLGVSMVVLLHCVHQPFFPPQISPLVAWLIYFAGVATASLVELVGGKWDNFFIPTASSTVMVFLYYLLGGF